MAISYKKLWKLLVKTAEEPREKYYTIFPSKYYATIQAPGSNQTINASSSVECLEKVLRFMAK